MRTIKFKAWDNINNKMYKFNDFGFGMEGYHNIYWNTDDIDNKEFWDLYNEEDKLVLMQFTGLKDKQGEELYEYDIVLVDGRRTICKYIEGEFKLERETDKNNNYCIGFIKESEIIGNIYQNLN